MCVIILAKAALRESKDIEEKSTLLKDKASLGALREFRILLNDKTHTCQEFAAELDSSSLRQAAELSKPECQSAKGQPFEGRGQRREKMASQSRTEPPPVRLIQVSISSLLRVDSLV